MLSNTAQPVTFVFTSKQKFLIRWLTLSKTCITNLLSCHWLNLTPWLTLQWHGPAKKSGPLYVLMCWWLVNLVSRCLVLICFDWLPRSDATFERPPCLSLSCFSFLYCQLLTLTLSLEVALLLSEWMARHGLDCDSHLCVAFLAVNKSTNIKNTEKTVL